MRCKADLRVFLTAHISLLIRTAAVLHVASAASPAPAAIVPFALPVAIVRAVVSHCVDLRLRERVLLCEKKSIGKVNAAARKLWGAPLRTWKFMNLTWQEWFTPHRPRYRPHRSSLMPREAQQAVFNTTTLLRRPARGQP